ncbi:hypothetical protein E2C01_021841 [Portunus trituberculatus]|uniref:Uncharacterized protein n=1 Tax=Portunus trituberculatus TaxID=210409 RepID=A0A5B7E3U7_PORTR|nr:hypothetical protein [Portunus trituberculatus]
MMLQSTSIQLSRFKGSSDSEALSCWDSCRPLMAGWGLGAFAGVNELVEAGEKLTKDNKTINKKKLTEMAVPKQGPEN